MNPIARVEHACARFVEEAFARVFPSDLDPAQVGRKLAAMMHAAPGDLYVVRVHPADYARLAQDRDFLEARWSALLREALPAGRRDQLPRALLHEDARVVAGSVAIETVADEPLGAGRALPDTDDGRLGWFVEHSRDEPMSPNAMGSSSASETNPSKTNPSETNPSETNPLGAVFFERTDGARVRLRDGLRIGRSATSDIVVRDGRASRQHARIVAQGDAFAIEDVGSSNGTFVDGLRTKRATLVPGATVTIGDTYLRVRNDAG